MISVSIQKFLLSLSNALVAFTWFRVLFVIVRNIFLSDAVKTTTCEILIRPRVITALWISCLELLQILLGLTSSKFNQVLLFSSVRLFVEMYISNLIPCNCWQHMCTITCWSVGEVVRFSCFSLDSLFTGFKKQKEVTPRIFKTIRYEVSGILFPIGAVMELVMVIRSAMDTSRLELYVAALLWPIGFIPLMRRLLKQRANHRLLNSEQNKKNVFV
jgi:hypothetical protein